MAGKKKKRRMTQEELFSTLRVAPVNGNGDRVHEPADIGLRTLAVRFTVSQYAHLRQLAAERGMSAAALIRGCTLRELAAFVDAIPDDKARKAWKRNAERIIVGGVA